MILFFISLKFLSSNIVLLPVKISFILGFKFILTLSFLSLINFSYNLDQGYGYINKSKGITYTIFNKKNFSQYYNFYEGCEFHYINILFNTNVDMNLFLKLITIDEFHYNLLDDTNPVLVCIDVKKEQIEKKINEVLLKNKILKLEK